MKVTSLTTIVASLFTGVVLARTPVYIFSNEVSTTPEQISFDTFSMFYSHMMDTNQRTSVVVQKEESSWLPKSNNLFENKLDANLVVLVSSVQTPQDILPTKDTSFYITDGDDIDEYSTLAKNIVEEKMDQDATVTTFKFPQVCHKETGASNVCSSRDTVTRFSRYFSDFETDLFDENKEADKQFMLEVETVQEYWSTLDISSNNLIQLNSLKALVESYGVQSEQYKEATRIISYLFESTVIPNFQTVYPHKSMAAFVFTPVTRFGKRAVDQDVCYKSARACRNGTDHCQGHGQCVEDSNGCFSCQCKPSYVGESCEYVDAVGDFQLLFWTSVLLIVITTSVVACIYQSGSDADTGIIMTQSPPKQE
ncbi:hypothetical protein G6F37_003936 [Rhizopus arrhizus]|nr:hypothetical protein G6F38_000277 [Rhizopus arrhizus]KAG1160502.1 hypothetical protein G6F37_003936 [Rhizopus arrhizus]